MDDSRHSSDNDANSRLNDAIASYIVLCDEGAENARDRVLLKYNDVADALRDYFADVDAIGSFALCNLDPIEQSLSDYADRFDEFELIEEIGRGGMGIVYKARELKLGRFVALKVSRQPSDGQTDAMLEEARRAATLAHPNIIPIYGAGSRDNIPYFYMEYVEGETLKTKARDCPLDASDAARYLIKISEAVHFIHGVGLLHRDIKSSNVIIDKNDEPRLTDFGLAKWQSNPVEGTAEFVGTPGYVAPEQARMGSEEVGRASDIYSLGATLYELIVGRPPFSGSSDALLRQQLLNEDPPHPTLLNRRIPKDLEAICLQCLNRDPTRRYPTAADLADDLRRFMRGEPVVARRIRWPTHVRLWCQRHPLAAGLSFLLLTTITIALLMVTTAWWQTRRALEETEHALFMSERSEYRFGIQQTHREWLAGNAESARRYLEECPDRHREWEWYYCKTLLESHLLSLDDAPGSYTCVTFSPDGQLLAVGGTSGLIELRDTGNGRRIRSLDERASQGKGPLKTERERERHRGSGDVMLLEFSSDGRYLASVQRDGTCHVWDLEGGRVVSEFTADGQQIVSMSLNPSATSIALVVQNGRGSLKNTSTRLHVYSIPQGNLQVERQWAKDGIHTITFNVDGSQILAGGANQLWTIDASTGEVACTTDLEYPTSSGAFPANGRYFASGFQRTVVLWDAKTGEKIRNFSRRQADTDTHLSNRFFQTLDVVTLSPTGRFLAAACEDRTIQIWDTQREGVFRLWRGHDSVPQAMTIDKAERRLAVATRNGVVKVWDLTQGQGSQVVHGRYAPSGVSCGSNMAWTDSDQLAMAISARPAVVLTQLSPDRDPARFFPNPTDVTENSKYVRCIAMTRDGRQMGTVTKNRHIEMWDLTTGEKLRQLDGSDHEVLRITFSPDGRYLASAGARVQEISEDTVAFRGTIVIWDTDSWSRIRRIETKSFPYVLKFRDDAHLIYHSNGLVSYNISTRKSTALLPQVKWASALAISHDRQRMVTGELDGTLRIWHINSGQVTEAIGHSGPVERVTYSPNGRRIVTGGSDGAIRIWDPDTGRVLMTLTGHLGRIEGLEFNDDATLLASTSNDGTVLIWRASGFQVNGKAP